ncbi:unnamed protein product [Cyprideis torosa]|uniref:GAF domain-containing protein n=1 Tax=Cyprideis torosa TaxID=163714 RepID=A0A7R8WUH4_9CRUS|nr:unnamed protein product [Cyprideis torosa]CAG0906932.1 unnamed protein product [Cyprideis torosa]
MPVPLPIAIRTNPMPASHRYTDVLPRIDALCEGEDNAVALMATIACELYRIEGFDWVGFYRVVAPGKLKVGPYQGGHGCLAIPFDRGVCGAAARERATQIVDDVDAFPGHIACSSSTRSEIVLPVIDDQGRLIAVLDIDSDTPAYFGEADRAALEAMLKRHFGKALDLT